MSLYVIVIGTSEIKALKDVLLERGIDYPVEQDALDEGDDEVAAALHALLYRAEMARLDAEEDTPHGYTIFDPESPYGPPVISETRMVNAYMLMKKALERIAASSDPHPHPLTAAGIARAALLEKQ